MITPSDTRHEEVEPGSIEPNYSCNIGGIDAPDGERKTARIAWLTHSHWVCLLFLVAYLKSKIKPIEYAPLFATLGNHLTI